MKTFENEVFGQTKAIDISSEIIRSDHLVAQNGRFITKPLYLGGGTMAPTVGIIFNFRLCESLKNELYFS